MKKILIIITVLVLLASVSKAMIPMTGPLEMPGPMGVPIPIEFYLFTQRHSRFVGIPAVTGYVCFYSPSYLLMYPFEAISRDVYKPSDLNVTPDTAQLIWGQMGGYLFSAPFYLLKKAFWDLPIYTWDCLTLNEEAFYKKYPPPFKMYTPEQFRFWKRAETLPETYPLYAVKVKDNKKGIINYFLFIDMPSGRAVPVDEGYRFDSFDDMVLTLQKAKKKFTIFSTDDESIINPVPADELIPLSKEDYLNLLLKKVIDKDQMPVFPGAKEQP